jgi:hypothetical protein
LLLLMLLLLMLLPLLLLPLQRSAAGLSLLHHKGLRLRRQLLLRCRPWL